MLALMAAGAFTSITSVMVVVIVTTVKMSNLNIVIVRRKTYFLAMRVDVSRDT